MDYKKKFDELTAYLNTIGESPAQRTKQWYEIRKTTIGGSEIATILNLNPFSKPMNLIEGKIGISSFNGNTATRWGNLFEQCTEDITKVALKMKDNVQPAGSIEGKIVRQRYSPDGLGIVEFLNEKDIPDYYTILFEFKSPYGSLPNGKIPKHYLPQVLTGLCSIDIAEAAIFTNSCFRKCALSDLNFTTKYDGNYHYGDFKKLKYGLNKEPYAIGMICFYQSNKKNKEVNKYFDDLYSDNTTYTMDIHSNCDDGGDYDSGDGDGDGDCYNDIDLEVLLSDKLIDIGMAPKDQTDRLLELHDKKIVKVKYCTLLPNSKMLNNMTLLDLHDIHHEHHEHSNAPSKYYKNKIKKMQTLCDNNKQKFIGYLPWKIMRLDMIHVARDDDWQETITKPIEELFKTLDYVLDAEDPVHRFYEIYPSGELDINDDDYNSFIGVKT